ncbi:hypothetical protein ACB316_22745, partial [Aeromonas sanarellii]
NMAIICRVLAGQGWRSYLRSRATPRSYEGMVKRFIPLPEHMMVFHIDSKYVEFLAFGWCSQLQSHDVVIGMNTRMVRPQTNPSNN